MYKYQNYPGDNKSRPVWHIRLKQQRISSRERSGSTGAPSRQIHRYTPYITTDVVSNFYTWRDGGKTCSLWRTTKVRD